jgi:quinol monooxygenase YgiN
MGELLGIARVKFHEGKVEEFKRLSAEAREVVRARDSGTLQYEVYLNADETEGVVLERYRDSKALIEHAANLSDAGLWDATLATGTFVGEILGEPSTELRERLADSPVRVFKLHQAL